MIGDRTFLTVDEMAALLGYSTKTIRRRIADGSIRKMPLATRSIRIPISELHRLRGITLDSDCPQISGPYQRIDGTFGEHT